MANHFWFSFSFFFFLIKQITLIKKKINWLADRCHRIVAPLSSDYGLLESDAAFVQIHPSSNSQFNSSNDIYSIEIKPKQGWPLDANTLKLLNIDECNVMKCRYCAMQYLKVNIICEHEHVKSVVWTKVNNCIPNSAIRVFVCVISINIDYYYTYYIDFQNWISLKLISFWRHINYE